MANITNQDLAEIFDKIGNLLEIKGEVIYKTLAYRKSPTACAPILEHFLLDFPLIICYDVLNQIDK